MASTYSPNLAIELIATGEQAGTWSVTTNTNLGTLIEQSISGYVTQAITDGSGANTTITIPDGATGVARNMTIEMTGALTFSTTSLIVPANKKLYFIFNNTSGGFAVTVKVSGQTGILVPNGKKVVLTSNGTDIVEAANQVVGAFGVGGTLSVSGTSTMAAINASGDVTVHSATSGNQLLTIGSSSVAGDTAAAITVFPSNVRRAWRVGFAYDVTDSFTITPSTANAGSTFTSPAFQILGSTGAVTIPGTLGVGAVGLGGSTPQAGVGLYSAVAYLTGNNQYGILWDSTLSGTSSSQVFAGTVQAAAATTITNGYGLSIGSATLGAGAAITTNYGIKIENQTVGGTNYAIYTGTGAVRLGDTLSVSGTSTMAAINASGSVTLSGTSFFRSPTTSNTPGTFNFYLAASGIREGTAGDFNIDTYSGGWGARLTVSQAGAVTIPGTATIQTLTVGLGAGAVASNTAVGQETLFSNTTGSFSVAVGRYALYANTTGINNGAFGRQSLSSNTTGSENTAVGSLALYANTTASSNTAVGYQAGYTNTTGTPIQAFGKWALYGNTTGTYNDAFGFNALGTNTTGGSNVGLGSYALYSNTTASNNTAVGYQALYANTTGSANVAVGNNALDASTTASYNSAFGAGAMGNTTTGSENSSFGFWSLLDNSTGNYNTAFGSEALRFNTTASNNTAVGYQAGYSNTTGSNNTSIGYTAGKAITTGNYNVAVGRLSMDGSVGVTGDENTALGNGTLRVITSGANNTATGSGALGSLTTASNNTAVGYQAAYTNTTGASNSVLGLQALYSNTTGSNNTAIGTAALNVNTTASNNTAVGYQALYANTIATANTAVGYQAGYSNTTAAGNTFTGYLTGRGTTTGGDNAAFGTNAFFTNTTGTNNTALGTNALYYNTTSNDNVGVGYQAGFAITTGGENTLLGTLAGASITTGTYNKCIGYRAAQYTTNLVTGNYNTYIGDYTAASSTSVEYEQVFGYAAAGKGTQTAFIGSTSGVYQGNNTTTWSTTSDLRIKKNIVDNNVGLEKIVAIQVRNFEYRLPEEIDAELKPSDAIKKEGIQLGVIAQELQQVLPECVKTESTGVMSVDADNLTWYLVNAIKELAADFQSYKNSHP